MYPLLDPPHKGEGRAELTVLIPTYHRPRLLRRAVESVVAQRHPDTTVAIYDNGADAATAEVAADFTRRGHLVTYHAHERNIGANANFIYALERMTSEYFVILSDDDLLLPGIMSRAMAAFASHPTALFVASPVLLVDPDGRVLRTIGDWPPGFYEMPRSLLAMSTREHFTWTGIVFRRTALQLAGNLDPAMGMLSDLDFLVRLAARGAFAVVDEPGAVFGWHPASNSSLPGIDLFWPAWGLIAAKLRADPALPVSLRTEAADRLERRFASRLPWIGLFASSLGKHVDARACADLLARRYRRIAPAAVVWTVSWLAQWFPPVRAGLAWLASIVRWPRRARMATTQARFDREFRPLFAIGEGDGSPRKDSVA